MRKLISLMLFVAFPVFGANCTNGPVSVLTTTTLLLAANSGYYSLTIQNTDAANPIFVGVNHAATTADFKIAANTSFTFPNNVPSAVMNAISTGGTVATILLACSQ